MSAWPITSAIAIHRYTHVSSPRSERVAQIVEVEVDDSCFLDRWALNCANVGDFRLSSRGSKYS